MCKFCEGRVHKLCFLLVHNIESIPDPGAVLFCGMSGRCRQDPTPLISPSSQVADVQTSCQRFESWTEERVAGAGTECMTTGISCPQFSAGSNIDPSSNSQSQCSRTSTDRRHHAECQRSLGAPPTGKGGGGALLDCLVDT